MQNKLKTFKYTFILNYGDDDNYFSMLDYKEITHWKKRASIGYKRQSTNKEVQNPSLENLEKNDEFLNTIQLYPG